MPHTYPYTGAFSTARNTDDLISKLNKQTAASTAGVKEHEELKVAFQQQTPEMRQKLIRTEIQSFMHAATMLRTYGLTIQDAARLITTA